VRPVSMLKSPEAVDPRTDMVVLCSNCHRMVHRRRDHILDLEGLRKLLRRG
jgi:5-methylcytosine-specific restriction protein A